MRRKRLYRKHPKRRRVRRRGRALFGLLPDPEPVPSFNSLLNGLIANPDSTGNAITTGLNFLKGLKRR